MSSIRTVSKDSVPTGSQRMACLRSNGIINYACDTDELHISLQSSTELEDDPLMTFQNQSTRGDGYRTDIHCHESKPIYSNARARRKLMIASIVCLLFVVAEFVGGLLAGSLAIMTDAAHMLSDFAAFLISLFAIWVAHWLPDKKRTFGYYRAEVLGALTSVLIIWVLTGVLVYLAVLRVITPDFEIKADIMLITAGVGLAVNILLGIILHQTGMGHHHSHGSGGGHSHNNNSHRSENAISHRISRSNSLHHSSEKQNINVRAAFIHVLGDIVQSVGVLIAAYIIKFRSCFKEGIRFILIMIVVLEYRDTIWVLLKAGTPKNIKYNNVKLALESIEGVVAAHSLHIWSLTMSKAALAVHLAIEPGHDSQKVLNIANQKLKNQFKIYHSTIQVELYQESVMRSCVDCQDLQD
ncbi:PREDICTED: zinc transporter 2-like [Acropora digitifera]|uniref:zinc transporter 2-like n=1 Tax=Acropora digitifera TaxID=70779 RepID=UPI00077B146D|nr:PREDICTED: zinc transporter 2-like [Acropora digitifera]